MARDAAALITRIRSRVNIADVTVLPAEDILEGLNDAQERMVQSSDEWRALDLTFPFTYGLGTDGVLLPSNLEKFADLYAIDSAQTDPSLRRAPLGQVDKGAWVERITQPDASDTFPVASVSGSYWYVWAEKIYLVPQPSAATAFELDYLGAPEDLTVSGPAAQNYFTRRYYRTLFWGGLIGVNDFLGEDDRAAFAERRFEKFLERAQAAETAYRTSGPKRTRGV